MVNPTNGEMHRGSHLTVGQRVSCTEYFVKRQEWMTQCHPEQPEAVGLILCPKSTCQIQLGVWGHRIQCTCDQ